MTALQTYLNDQITKIKYYNYENTITISNDNNSTRNEWNNRMDKK